MDGADQRESLHRVKNHLMNIYGGRFWFSLNVNGYTTLGERKRTQCAEAAREDKKPLTAPLSAEHRRPQSGREAQRVADVKRCQNNGLRTKCA